MIIKKRINKIFADTAKKYNKEITDENNTPKFIFINKIDSQKAKYNKVLEQLRERYGKKIATPAEGQIYEKKLLQPRIRYKKKASPAEDQIWKKQLLQPRVRCI